MERREKKKQYGIHSYSACLTHDYTYTITPFLPLFPSIVLPNHKLNKLSISVSIPKRSSSLESGKKIIQAMPIYFMGIYKLPISMIKDINSTTLKSFSGVMPIWSKKYIGAQLGRTVLAHKGNTILGRFDNALLGK